MASEHDALDQRLDFCDIQDASQKELCRSIGVLARIADLIPNPRSELREPYTIGTKLLNLDDVLLHRSPRILEVCSQTKFASASKKKLAELNKDLPIAPKGLLTATDDYERVRFTDQGVLPSNQGLGTAFLVAPDIIATAEHVIYGNSDATDFCFVLDFCFNGDKSKMDPKIHMVKEILYQSKTWGGKNPAGTDDFALLRLEKALERPFLKFNKTYKANSKVWAAGYPRGLPLKYTSGDTKQVEVRKGFEGGYVQHPDVSLTTNLYLCPGNSGGPILDEENLVIGIVSAVDKVEYRVDEASNLLKSYQNSAMSDAEGWRADRALLLMSKDVEAKLHFSFNAIYATSESYYMIISCDGEAPIAREIGDYTTEDAFDWPDLMKLDSLRNGAVDLTRPLSSTQGRRSICITAVSKAKKPLDIPSGIRSLILRLEDPVTHRFIDLPVYDAEDESNNDNAANNSSSSGRGGRSASVLLRNCEPHSFLIPTVLRGLDEARTSRSEGQEVELQVVEAFRKNLEDEKARLQAKAIADDAAAKASFEEADAALDAILAGLN